MFEFGFVFGFEFRRVFGFGFVFQFRFGFTFVVRFEFGPRSVVVFIGIIFTFRLVTSHNYIDN